MSGSKAARNAASIVNRTNICGGPKKAGLAPTSGYYFLTGNPSLTGAPQTIPRFCIPNTTVQTQSWAYLKGRL